MAFYSKGSVCGVLLCGMLLCTVGCTSSDSDSEASTMKTAEVSSAVAKDTTVPFTDIETEITSSAQTELPGAMYPTANVTVWELPAALETLQTVRISKDTVYLLGSSVNAEGKVDSVLYYAAASEKPSFTLLYENADASDFEGLMDFDVLSDGTVCGLICENTNAVPYDDPSFDPDQFDWETYYKNYTMQYQLVWYDCNGVISKKLGLSTLLDPDESARQTMAFTGVRCDASDHVYLTATIDTSDCLMALDDNGNLSPVQGNAEHMLTLESDYQWIRCSTDGMLLLECDADDVQQLSHLVVTDGALWKTQAAVPELMDTQSVLTQSDTQGQLYGIRDENGLYGVAEKNAVPQLLYQWETLHVDASELDAAFLLSGDCALLMLSTPQGELSLEYVSPETEKDDETATTATTTPFAESEKGQSRADDTQTSPPIATPVSVS